MEMLQFTSHYCTINISLSLCLHNGFPRAKFTNSIVISTGALCTIIVFTTTTLWCPTIAQTGALCTNIVFTTATLWYPSVAQTFLTCAKTRVLRTRSSKEVRFFQFFLRLIKFKMIFTHFFIFDPRARDDKTFIVY